MEIKDTSVDNLHYKGLFDFIAACGQAHDPKSFATAILSNIEPLCSFDQAFVYFLDDAGKLCDHQLLNISECWSSIYFGYYANSENQQYKYMADFKEDPDHILLVVFDWEKESSSEFVPQYIRPRGLKYSCAFALSDLDGNFRTVFSLDRVRDIAFSPEDLMNLQQTVPLLNNLHKNLYYQDHNQTENKQIHWESANLTPREIEIADLLCQGISPTSISDTLFIAQSTTYKHIAHIYEKMKVSSQQELLVSLLHPTD